MNVFGFEFTFRRKKKALPSNLSSVWNSSNWYGPWFGPITESFSGAWQKNVTVAPTQTLLSVSAVYACVTGIARDIAKMRIKLMRNMSDDIWEEIKSGSPFLPILRKPNHYQTSIKFVEHWVTSLLMFGNTYVLKQRQDARGLVTALYVLHPNLVRALVAEDSSVYYEISRDDLSQVKDRIIVPASEIIHDTINPLWHPLVGISPIYACAISATMTNNIQGNSNNLFANRSMPGGVVSVPGEITKEQADAIKTAFEAGYSAEKIGKIAVLSDGMTFTPVTITATDAQLIEQLKWTVEDVARAFHYPLWKLTGSFPPYSAAPQVLNTIYYQDCLHPIIENIEKLLDEGLVVPSDMGTELDTDNLLRMDTASLFDSNDKARRFMTPNEMRRRANLGPVEGGDTVYGQEQDHSLEALAERDRRLVEGPEPVEVLPAESETNEEEAPKLLGESTEKAIVDLDQFESEIEAELKEMVY